MAQALPFLYAHVVRGSTAEGERSDMEAAAHMAWDLADVADKVWKKRAREQD